MKNHILKIILLLMLAPVAHAADLVGEKEALLQPVYSKASGYTDLEQAKEREYNNTTAYFVKAGASLGFLLGGVAGLLSGGVGSVMIFGAWAGGSVSASLAAGGAIGFAVLGGGGACACGLTCKACTRPYTPSKSIN